MKLNTRRFEVTLCKLLRTHCKMQGGWGAGGGGTPYNGLYGDAPSKRDTFFRLQYGFYS